MRYRAMVFCAKCDPSGGHMTEMYSGGVCPYCGHNGNSTVCDTVTKAARWVYDFYPSWWEWVVQWKGSRGHWDFKGKK